LRGEKRGENKAEGKGQKDKYVIFSIEVWLSSYEGGCAKPD